MKRIRQPEKRPGSLHVRSRKLSTRGDGTDALPVAGKIVRFKSSNFRKPIMRLHRSLKRLPRQPSPDEIHQLRAEIRSFEAIMDAVESGRKHKTRHLLKAVVLVSKAAGKVRDMDVLVELACSLPTGRNAECRVQLLEHLGNRRFKAAAKLEAIISAQKKEVFHCLKQCSRLIEKSLDSTEKNQSVNLSVETAALVRTLAGKLSNCPRLNEDSLHSFRLKIKELRSILQLLSDSRMKFVATLGKAKDAIGEWHDWSELAVIAQRVLTPGPAYELQKQVQLISREKLKRAIAIANEIRKNA